MATSADNLRLKERDLLNLTSEDISLLAKSMFYETKLVIVLGLLTCFADFLLVPVVEKNQGSPFLLFVPLAFLTVTVIVKLVERSIFGDNPSLRTLRIIQGLFLLAVVALSRLPAFLVPLEYLKEMERSSSSTTVSAVSSVVNTWLTIATTFPGACGTVIMYRFIVEFGVKAHLLEGFPFAFSMLGLDGGKGKKAEGKKLPKKYEDEGSPALNNAGLNDCNANYS